MPAKKRSSRRNKPVEESPEPEQEAAGSPEQAEGSQGSPAQEPEEESMETLQLEAEPEPEEPENKKEESEEPEEPEAKKPRVDEEANGNSNGNGEAEKKKEAEVEKPYERSPELAKFWKAVDDDPADFTGWTYLLQYVDTNGTVAEGEEAYDAFLFRYPYCYGYWKKYADFEKRKGDKDKCMAVFERGIRAIPLSADLWIHFLTHCKAEYMETRPEFVREQYERSVAACGREWRSDKLWDNYVKWEAGDVKSPVNVLKLYDRIVSNPTQGLSHQFEMLRDFVKEHPPKDLLEVNEFLALRKEVLDDAAREQKAKLDKEKRRGKSSEKDAPGENDEADDEELPPVQLSEEEETAALRERILAARKKLYKVTEEKVSVRWKFEDAIKRPYFHMKPLERGQLKNWNEYLDFEIKEQEKVEGGGGDMETIRILFERCLIACALYEEFWLKMVGWFASRKDADHVEDIRDVYTRATSHHLPGKVDIHVKFAAFEEEQGNCDKAAEILQKIEAKHPEMMSLQLRRINLERRRGNSDAVHTLYKSCIDKAKKTVKSDLVVKYGRFLRLHLRDTPAAKRALHEALLEDESNPKLHLQLLDIALHESPLDNEAVVALLDAAVAKSKVAKNKVLFAQRKVDFLEDFGTSVQELGAAQEEHKKIAAEAREEAAKEAAKAPSAAGDKTEGSGIKTIEGRGGKPSNGSSSYPATNSASYGAHHNSQYQQYGSRYNSSYGSYGSGYGSGSGGYGGSSGGGYSGGGGGGGYQGGYSGSGGY